ncbi:MAG: hypothetical protein Q7T26_12750 [Dehalococcoidia bacterium]|nr:hypothetical protein [Dehalococcoidia bacterium]
MAIRMQHVETIERTSTETKIIEYLRANRSATLPVLCRALGIRTSQVAWTIVHLEEQGLLTSIARGKSRSFILAAGLSGRKAA